MAKVIGIDLGTTNSCLSFMEGMEPVVVPNKEGARTTPSLVAVTEGGDRLVGQIAKRQAVTNPLNTVFAVKRLIGRKFQSPEIGKARERLPFELVEAPNGDVWVKLRGQEMSPPEISSMVLRELKEAAEEFFGEDVDQAVITVPAYFNDHQRQATKDAGRIAGLEVLRIINEPTAACLAYNLGENDDKVVGVYDLGGGTFDVSILRVGGGVYEVIATSGDTFLGGEDFDNAILDFLVDQFQEETGLDLRGDKLALQRLKEAVEKAKCELSTIPNTEISLPFISADATGPKHLNTVLTRAKLEELIQPLVDRTRQPCEDAMSMAELDADGIDEILLVGGQTRTPLVKKMVEEIFAKEPRTDRNPDEVVAIGAAVQAGIITGDVKDMVLLDVTPLSLGVSTKGGIFVRLIDRGSSVPTRHSRIFTTVMDNQDTVEVHVLQGEREVASQNISLGKFELIGIPPAPKGVPQIEVAFEINSNGIVNVGAKDMTSGREQKIVVNPSSGLSDDEIDKIIDEARDHADEDRQRNEFMKLKLRVEHLLDANTKAFTEFAELLKDEDRESCQGILTRAKKAVDSQSISEATGALAELATVSGLLAEVMLFNPANMDGDGGGGDKAAEESKKEEGEKKEG